MDILFDCRNMKFQIGGRITHNLDTNEQYNPVFDTWTQVYALIDFSIILMIHIFSASMPTKRSGCAAATIQQVSHYRSFCGSNFYVLNSIRREYSFLEE
jgi:hypothetical protein